MSIFVASESQQGEGKGRQREEPKGEGKGRQQGEGKGRQQGEGKPRPYISTYHGKIDRALDRLIPGRRSENHDHTIRR